MAIQEAMKKRFIPLAVLVAKTREAKIAIMDNSGKQDFIPIWSFPFRVGRESRVEVSDWGIKVCRRLLGDITPNNDFYLLDTEEYFHISREHFIIERYNKNYIIKDRKSACGTTINKNTFFDTSLELHSGDTVQIGGIHSPYIYEFIVLDE